MPGIRLCAEVEGSKKAPTSGSTKQLAGLGRAVGIWSRASGKLFSLEARIKDQVGKLCVTCRCIGSVQDLVMLHQTEVSCKRGCQLEMLCRPADCTAVGTQGVAVLRQLLVV